MGAGPEVHPILKTVAIVGLAPSTRELALQEPPGVEIWSLNQGHTLFPPELMARMTRWFQIHPWEEMVARQNQRDHHLEWLGQATIPVYLAESRPDDVPRGVRYPLEEVVADLGTDYLTSALAFMLALAVHERFEVVHIYGADMAHGTEYFDQRNCLEYLAGLARGRGITVWVPEVCPLFKGQRYARSVNIPSTRVARLMAQLTRQKVVKKDEANALIGALRFAQQLLPQPEMTGEAHELLGATYEDLLTELKQKLAEYHSVLGAEELCEQLLRECLKDVPVELEAVAEVGRQQVDGYHPELLPPGSVRQAHDAAVALEA